MDIIEQLDGLETLKFERVYDLEIIYLKNSPIKNLNTGARIDDINRVQNLLYSFYSVVPFEKTLCGTFLCVAVMAITQL